jgi:hypothetical protein
MRGNVFDRWTWQWGAKDCPQAQRAPNLARPGFKFSEDYLNPGFASPATIRPNLRNLGKMYQHGERSAAVVNPVNKPLTDRRVYSRVLSSERGELTGVTKNSAGAALGSCRVMVYRASDLVFVGETTSDGSGNWTITVPAAWTHFLVAYLVGSPDVAGTSRNDLIPTLI